MTHHSVNPYTVLGVTPAATPADLTEAFRLRLRNLQTEIADGTTRVRTSTMRSCAI